MLLRRAEFDAVPELRLRLAEFFAASLARGDHQRHVISVAVDPAAAWHDAERKPFCLEESLVGRHDTAAS